jgi:hypothetical protein
MGNYASVLVLLNRHDEAERLFHRLLELRTEIQGERAPDTIAALSQCHQDKVLLRRPLNIQSGFVSIGLSRPIKWR